MKNIIFLDIEGTLIEDFDNPTMLTENKSKVSQLIKDAKEIICFSWAINNSSDLLKRLFTINRIESEFGFKFDSFIFRDDMFPMFKGMFGSGLDFNEFEDICRSLGKEIVFQMFIRKMFIKDNKELTNFFLLDDKVERTTLKVNNNYHTIATMPV